MITLSPRADRGTPTMWAAGLKVKLPAREEADWKEADWAEHVQRWAELGSLISSQIKLRWPAEEGAKKKLLVHLHEVWRVSCQLHNVVTDVLNTASATEDLRVVDAPGINGSRAAWTSRTDLQTLRREREVTVDSVRQLEDGSSVAFSSVCSISPSVAVAAADLPAVQVVLQSSCTNEQSGGRRRRNAIECESAEL